MNNAFLHPNSRWHHVHIWYVHSRSLKIAWPQNIFYQISCQCQTRITPCRFKPFPIVLFLLSSISKIWWLMENILSKSRRMTWRQGLSCSAFDYPLLIEILETHSLKASCLKVSCSPNTVTFWTLYSNLTWWSASQSWPFLICSSQWHGDLAQHVSNHGSYHPIQPKIFDQTSSPIYAIFCLKNYDMLVQRSM